MPCIDFLVVVESDLFGTVIRSARSYWRTHHLAAGPSASPRPSATSTLSCRSRKRSWRCRCPAASSPDIRPAGTAEFARRGPETGAGPRSQACKPRYIRRPNIIQLWWHTGVARPLCSVRWRQQMEREPASSATAPVSHRPSQPSLV